MRQSKTLPVVKSAPIFTLNNIIGLSLIICIAFLGYEVFSALDTFNTVNTPELYK